MNGIRLFISPAADASAWKQHLQFVAEVMSRYVPQIQARHVVIRWKEVQSRSDPGCLALQQHATRVLCRTPPCPTPPSLPIVLVWLGMAAQHVNVVKVQWHSSPGSPRSDVVHAYAWPSFHDAVSQTVQSQSWYCEALGGHNNNIAFLTSRYASQHMHVGTGVLCLLTVPAPKHTLITATNCSSAATSNGAAGVAQFHVLSYSLHVPTSKL